jgi:uncharacterized protein YdeI (BOF family)
MKMQWILLVIAVLALVAMVGVAAADDKPKAPAGNPGTTGVVDQVDAPNKTITLKKTKKDEAAITVVVNDQTKFSRQEGKESRAAQFTDVAAGNNVVIVHEAKDGKQVASSVTIVARPAKP